MNEKDKTSVAERRLHERLLLGRAAPDDHLRLADATLLAALDGSRPLTANERAALAGSPLTLRRLRALSNDARGRAAATARETPPAGASSRAPPRSRP